MRTSAGLLLYRRSTASEPDGHATGADGRRAPAVAGPASFEVLLVHPGGPFFARRNLGAWTIPKGEPNPGESLEDAARREFSEETGYVPTGDLVELAPVTQRGGKRVHAWAVEGDWDASTLACNTFRMEWPARSGQWRTFPEVDRAKWCTVQEARRLMNPAQSAWLDQLIARLAGPPRVDRPGAGEDDDA